MEFEQTNIKHQTERGLKMLVVVAKIKKHIKKGGMITSGSAVKKLSEVVGELCTAAIEKAKKDHRKTVMDRDIDAVLDDMAKQ